MVLSATTSACHGSDKRRDAGDEAGGDAVGMAITVNIEANFGHAVIGVDMVFKDFGIVDEGFITSAAISRGEDMVECLLLARGELHVGVHRPCIQPIHAKFLLPKVHFGTFRLHVQVADKEPFAGLYEARAHSVAAIGLDMP